MPTDFHSAPIRWRGRRSIAFAIVVFAVTWALVGPTGSPPAGSREAPARPNVLLISIDSLRSDHLGTYGYARNTSPVIDDLAARGVLFESVVAPSSWTLPSHVTLFTAKAPEEHRVVSFTAKLEDGVQTLTEIFRDSGYATAGIVVGPLLRERYGYARGFEHFDESLAATDVFGSHEGVTSNIVVDRALEWLSSSRAGAPFFLFLHLWDVHYDYTPPPPYDTIFDPEYDGDISGEGFITNPAIHAEMPARDLEHVVALYDGEIRFTDAQIGRLLEDLEERGVLDDTLVVVTSDHGEEFFEHGKHGHGGALFDESIMIPLVLFWPSGLEGGRRVTEQVRLADVPYTLLGLTGVERPRGFGPAAAVEGGAVDLSPWVQDAARAPGSLSAFSETTLIGGPRRSIRTPRHKVIRAGTSVKVYDLRADPKETRDLETAEPRAASNEREALAAWSREWKNAGANFSEFLPPDPDHIARLRALGYIP